MSLTSILERLGTLELMAQCHDANAVQLVDALSSTKRIDQKHDANAARLEQRINRLEVQAESHRSHIESLQNRNRTLEEQLERALTRTQTLEEQLETALTRTQTLEALLQQQTVVISRKLAATPSQHTALSPDTSPGVFVRSDACASAAHSRPASHSSQSPQSAPMSAMQSLSMHETSERTSSACALRSSSASALAAPVASFKRRARWQQVRPTADVHPRHEAPPHANMSHETPKLSPWLSFAAPIAPEAPAIRRHEGCAPHGTMLHAITSAGLAVGPAGTSSTSPAASSLTQSWEYIPLDDVIDFLMRE